MTDNDELIFEENSDELAHYGTPQLYPGDPHGSGRYREVLVTIQINMVQMIF